MPPCAPLPCRGGCYHTPSPCEAVYHRGSPPCALNRSEWLPKARYTLLHLGHSPMREKTADGRKRPSLRRKSPSSPNGAPPQPSSVKASGLRAVAVQHPRLHCAPLHCVSTKRDGRCSLRSLRRSLCSVRLLFSVPCSVPLAWLRRCSGTVLALAFRCGEV